jgi:hypothetical protein
MNEFIGEGGIIGIAAIKEGRTKMLLKNVGTGLVPA